MKKLVLVVLFLVTANFLTSSSFIAKVWAQSQAESFLEKQESLFKGRVKEVLSAEDEGQSDKSSGQQLKVELTTGPRVGEQIKARAIQLTAQQPNFKTGDQVVVETIQTQQGQELIVTDHVRLDSLWVAGVLFVIAVIAVSRAKGLRSLLAMGITFLVLVLVLLPLLIKGVNPVLLSLAAALIIIPLTFYLSHGLKKQTHIAVLGTVLALAATSLLASVLVNNAHLTGFSSEEAGFLSLEKRGQLNIQGLLLASIIIGLLGTLDDITVTQAGLVFQLREHDSKMTFKQLYQEAMEIGQDHIASMVNTLVLVYTGASLPLLLLFINNPQPLWFVVNQELVAEEIVRMLVGSIGLVLAAPVTTLLASLLADRDQLSKLIKVRS